MNAEFFSAIEDLEKEKGIPREYMYDKIKQAMLAAFRRDNPECADNVDILLDEDRKRIEMYVNKVAVEQVEEPALEIDLEAAKKITKRAKLGDTIKIPVETKKFGRIAAQAAKQVIIQGIREAERSMMIKEYESKKEEIITAIVDKIDPENEDVLVDTGTSKVYLKKAEQIPGEHFNVGDHIKVFVTEVMKESLRGPLVSLSRTAPGLVKRLFELEIPEIQQGVVVIMSITREAGSRTKMAVMSRDANVDPIGACIGNKGMRIQSIVSELRGEKIDVIKYSEDPVEYISAALSPATVKEVIIDSEKSCRVVVDADQLSLAIGKEGQNARLAARLTGYKIDIKTRAALEEEEAKKRAFLEAAEKEQEREDEEDAEIEAQAAHKEAHPEEAATVQTGAEETTDGTVGDDEV